MEKAAPLSPFMKSPVTDEHVAPFIAIRLCESLPESATQLAESNLYHRNGTNAVLPMPLIKMGYPLLDTFTLELDWTT
jgi:hypothetical protein